MVKFVQPSWKFLEGRDWGSRVCLSPPQQSTGDGMGSIEIICDLIGTHENMFVYDLTNPTCGL